MSKIVTLIFICELYSIPDFYVLTSLHRFLYLKDMEFQISVGTDFHMWYTEDSMLHVWKLEQRFSFVIYRLFPISCRKWVAIFQMWNIENSYVTWENWHCIVIHEIQRKRNSILFVGLSGSIFLYMKHEKFHVWKSPSSGLYDHSRVSLTFVRKSSYIFSNMKYPEWHRAEQYMFIFSTVKYTSFHISLRKICTMISTCETYRIPYFTF